MLDLRDFVFICFICMIIMLYGCSTQTPIKRVPQQYAIISLVNVEKTCTVKTNPDKWWRE